MTQCSVLIFCTLCLLDFEVWGKSRNGKNKDAKLKGKGGNMISNVSIKIFIYEICTTVPFIASIASCLAILISHSVPLHNQKKIKFWRPGVE